MYTRDEEDKQGENEDRDAQPYIGLETSGQHCLGVTQGYLGTSAVVTYLAGTT